MVVSQNRIEYAKYNHHMGKSVVIRVSKETRDKLHSIKNPGQTLDGIITQSIDLWERQKLEAAQPKKD